jgi:hypothetical protein
MSKVPSEVEYTATTVFLQKTCSAITSPATLLESGHSTDSRRRQRAHVYPNDSCRLLRSIGALPRLGLARFVWVVALPLMSHVVSLVELDRCRLDRVLRLRERVRLVENDLMFSKNLVRVRFGHRGLRFCSVLAGGGSTVAAPAGWPRPQNALAVEGN